MGEQCEDEAGEEENAEMERVTFIYGRLRLYGPARQPRKSPQIPCRSTKGAPSLARCPAFDIFVRLTFGVKHPAS